jgi:hypothetical protein
MNTLTAYLAAVLGTLFIGCASVVALELGRPAGYNSQSAYTIIGMCTTVLTVLLAIIKSIGNGQDLADVKRGTEETKSAAVAAAQHAAVAAQNAAAVPSVTAQAVEAVIEKKLPVGS